jgi:spore coat protein U-like protein
MRAQPVMARALALLLMWCGGAAAQICTITSSAMAFGAYNPASSANVDAIGQVKVNCLLPTLVTFKLSVGNGAGARYSTGRKMTRTAGGGTLIYNLYTSAARTTVLGDGTDGSQYANDFGLWFAHTLQVYGRIRGPQPTVQPGSYVDTVIVTASY